MERENFAITSIILGSLLAINPVISSGESFANEFNSSQFRYEAQAPRGLDCRLGRESPPSSQSREIRSTRYSLRFQIPVNYRAVAERDSILIFSPEAYEYHLCEPPTSLYYMAAWVDVNESSSSSSEPLRQAFEALRGEQSFSTQGGIQQVTVAGEPALRYHMEAGGDGLTRNYVLFSPQRTKLITIGTWVDSINSPEPPMLSRLRDSFALVYDVNDSSPRVGIVPTLDVCGLSVWQRPGDNLTHILTAHGGSSFARMRINGQMLQLRVSGGAIGPEQTQRPSTYTFTNNDGSIRAALRGSWRTESPGAQAGWITNDGVLEVSQGNQTATLPVAASLGCNFLFY